ncbi:unnamed protein product [Ectocarpus sp. CCAP 1310/34]|nr:unnamed protein product [Ectocarpus sp. CCAP 1310/34]
MVHEEMAQAGGGSVREAPAREGSRSREYGHLRTEEKESRGSGGGGKKRRPGTAVEASRAAEAALVANYVPG